MGGGGRGVPQVALGHTVLGLTMVVQGPFRQLRIALGATDLLAEPFRVGVSLPRHLEAVGLHKVPPKRAESLTIHANHIDHIGVEDQVV